MAKEQKQGQNLESQEQLIKLKDQIDKIYKSEEVSARRKKMARFLSEYNGVWWKNEDGGDALEPHESRAAINYVFSTISSLVPLLTDNRPIWNVIARRAYEQSAADLYNNALEYLWNVLDMDTHLVKQAYNCLLFGVGIGKFWFDPDRDDLAIQVIDPRNFVIAPGYEDIWEAPWMGTIEKKPITLLKRLYPDVDIEVGSDSDDDDDKYTKEEQDRFAEQEEFATVYEIWMVDYEVEELILEEEDGQTGEAKKTKVSQPKYPNGRILVFTSDGTLLEDKPSVYAHGRCPYISFHDYHVPNSFWSMGEVDQIENLNREFNLRLSQLTDHARKFSKPNYIASKRLGIKADDLKQAIRRGDQVLMSDGETVQGMITEIPVPNINSSVLALLNNLPKWIEEVSGVTDISKGVDDKKERRSASEASILIESSYTRIRQKVRNLEQYIKRCAVIMIELVQQFYDTPRDFTNVKDNTVSFRTISNSPNIIADELGKDLPDTEKMILPELELSDIEKQKLEDYEQLIESFRGKDRVYFKFDIQVQTNSTLPADKQSLVNMALRLLEMKAIDEQAVLEIVRFPNASEIIRRMNEKAQQEAQGQGGPPPGPGGPMPEGPQMGGPSVPGLQRMAQGG